MVKEKISVIVPTLHRRKEVEELLDSLTKSNLQPLEVIIIDQNQSDLLDSTIFSYKDVLPIIHLKVNFKGASKARNCGILKSSGDILCFPDDDARFFEDTIEIAIDTLKSGNDVVFGKCVDENGLNSVVAFKTKASPIRMYDLEGKFAEATMFSYKELLVKNLYDEGLGVGTFHGAEEAYDLVLRLLKQNKKLYYDPNIVFYHPSRILNHVSENEIRRVFSYRCGFAKLCLKHKLYRKLLFRFFSVLGYSIFLVLTGNKKMRYYLAEFAGIFSGMIIK